SYDVPFTIVLPRTGRCANLPLVIFQHGVTEERSRLFTDANGLAAHGIAVAAIDFPFHGSRAAMPRDVKNNATNEICAGTGPCDHFGDQQALNAAIGFFTVAGDANVVAGDPRGGRDNFRQAAADVMQLVRTLTVGDLSPITRAAGAPT